jgi:hypothetical protein
MPDAGTKTDGAAVLKYSAVMPDAGQKDTGGMVALYMAMMPDGGAILRYMAVMPVDAAGRDAGPGPVLLYMAPMPAKK